MKKRGRILKFLLPSTSLTPSHIFSQLVKERRQKIDPNPGFVLQLRLWEAHLHSPCHVITSLFIKNALHSESVSQSSDCSLSPNHRSEYNLPVEWEIVARQESDAEEEGGGKEKKKVVIKERERNEEGEGEMSLSLEMEVEGDVCEGAESCHFGAIDQRAAEILLRWENAVWHRECPKFVNLFDCFLVGVFSHSSTP